MNSDYPMLSDQSEENNEDFLEGLKEMGLLGASGDNSPDNSSVKPAKSKEKPAPVAKSANPKKEKTAADLSTPKSKSNGGNKSKRRPPSRRPVINIDDLLDGIGPPSPEPVSGAVAASNRVSENLTAASINLTASNNLPHGGNTGDFSLIQVAQSDSSFTSRVELNIQSYLTTRFLNLRDDFISELQHLLIETDCIEVEVNKFLSDLKIALRDILSFDIKNASQTNQVLSVLDTICPAFLTVMKSIPDINDRERQAEAESAALAQVAVSTFSPLLKENFKSLADELSHDITELHELQAQVRKNEAKNTRQKKVLNETLLDYESQKISQQIEAQTVSELSQKIAEFRKVINDEDDDDDVEYEEEPTDRMSKKLKNALFKLKKEAETTHLEPSARIRSFRRRLNDYREEASTMRNMILYNNQMFASRSFQAMQAAAQPDLLPQPAMQSLSPMQRTIPMPETPPRVSFPGFSDEGSGYQERNFELIDNVRSRLKQIQDQHDADLQNISSFLQSLKKSEKQRLRSEVLTD